MANQSVFLNCVECHSWSTPAVGSMQCGNCGSWDTTLYKPVPPEMSEQAWNQVGYIWAKLRELDWYHAMADIESNRKEFGDADTLQYLCEMQAKAHLTPRAADSLKAGETRQPDTVKVESALPASSG